MSDHWLRWATRQYAALRLSPDTTLPGSNRFHRMKRPCALESLHKDALTAIMSKLDTLSDLNNFIHASPILYHCFLEEKRSILLTIASRELGPVLPDAVVLAQTKRLNWYDEDYYDKVDDAVKEYGRRLALDQPPTRGVDTATVVRIIQINRATRFFVDLYATTRLHVLRGIGPESATPLSENEQTRLSLAHIRLQILTRLYPRWSPPDNLSPNEERVFGKFYSLFRPWELEQISEANGAVLNACKALMNYEAPDPLLRISDYGGGRTEYYDKFYWDLEVFQRKVFAVSAEDGGLVRRMCTSMSEEKNCRMAGSLVSPLDGSHRFEDQSTMSYPTHEELCGPRPTGVSVHATKDAPHGWIDALEGRDWQVWGLDLLQRPPPLGDWPHGERWGTKGRLERWRWMGVVFWDESRVELVKQTATFSYYQTGWLVRLRASAP